MDTEVYLTKESAEQINALHAERIELSETLLIKARKIGDLLILAKQGTIHNFWLEWVSDNLTFGRHQATKCM